VQPALALGLPFEVFDNVGEVNLCGIDPNFVQHTTEKFARRTHEWPALKVLLIARDFPDEQDSGFRWTFSKDGLRPGLPQGTSPAIRRPLPKSGEISIRFHADIGRLRCHGKVVSFGPV
jgi:hypothetical protein